MNNEVTQRLPTPLKNFINAESFAERMIKEEYLYDRKKIDREIKNKQ
jgi:hypothetical protein